MSVRPLAILLLLSLVLPVAAAGLFSWYLYRNTLTEGATSAQHTAFVLREHALRVFEAQESAIRAIDARIAGMSWSQIRSSGELHEFLRATASASPHIDGLWLIGPDGVTANSADFFPMPRVTPVERDYFRVLSQHDVTYLGEVIRGTLKGNLNFNLSRRRSGSSGFDGVILVTVTLRYFEDFWRNVIDHGNHSVAILRDDGSILVRYPALRNIPGHVPDYSPFVELSRSADAGTYELRAGADGRERIYGFARLGAYPAFISVGMDRETVLASWIRQSALLAAVALLTSLALSGGVALAWRNQRRLSQEIARRKTAETTLIAKEEHLSAIQQIELNLRRSEERFRSLFETMNQAVIFNDTACNVTSLNPIAERSLGLDADSLVGVELAKVLQFFNASGERLHPDEHPVRIARQTGKALQNVTLGMQNASSEDLRWIIMDAVPLRRPWEDHPWAIVTLFKDITEQRRNEEAQRLLANEVDHRAKNALAVVQAVLRLTRADSTEQYVEAVEGRVAALSRAHTLLARSQWQGADLTTLLEEELSPYRSDETRRITISGPPLILQAHAAQPFGMVIHELATNAAKYGALSLPAGQLTVTWTLNETRDMVAMTWIESDGPLVTKPARAGFGSRLVRSSLEVQLGGQLEADWRESGLRIMLRMPVNHFKSGRAEEPAGPRETSAPEQVNLAGLRILVAEDNVAIAMDLCEALAELGCDVIGPASTLNEAAGFAVSEALDAAVLDVDLHGRAVFPVSELLMERDIPVIFCTGFTDIERLRGHWSSSPVLRKPVRRQDLVRVLQRILRRSEQMSLGLEQ